VANTRAEVYQTFKLSSDPRIGVHLLGAYVTGTVDSANVDAQAPLRFEVCRFEENLDLTEAHVGSLRVMRCAVVTLRADGLESDHSLHLNRSRLLDLVLTEASIWGRLGRR
jgi:hypothetical protein